MNKNSSSTQLTKLILGNVGSISRHPEHQLLTPQTINNLSKSSTRQSHLMRAWLLRSAGVISCILGIGLFDVPKSLAAANVSGTVFDDVNSNGIQDTGESGISGVSIVLQRRAAPITCQSVKTDSSGNYTFLNVAAASYNIIEAANATAPSSSVTPCPPTAADPAGYVSTTANTIIVTVASTNLGGRNFGDRTPLMTFNCPVGTIATGSGYAASGAGTYFGQNAIYWLDWSCGSATRFLPGDTITKTWTAPNGIGIAATISGITKIIGPYNTGAFGGDKLDDLYTGVNPIGLTNVTAGEDPTYRISFSMTLNGVPIPADIATAEAESTDGPNESATWTTDGDAWQVLEASGTALQATFSNAGKTLFMNDNPDSGAATLVAITENVSNIDVSMLAGGKEAIAFGIFVPFDYGDAPSTYGSAPHYARRDATGGSQPTTATGISSLTMATLSYGTPYLGAIGPDPERVPIPSATATGDNGAGGISDEDAFTSLPKIAKNTTYSLSNIPVNNTSVTDATLSAWIDFNKNGVFEASEFTSTTVISGATTANLSWTVPAGTAGGATFVRFRITTSPLIDDPGTPNVDERATATANNGESEDYQVTIGKTNILLVKRITAINGVAINTYKDDTTSPKAADDNHTNWPTPLNTNSGQGDTTISTFLRGAIDAGKVKSTDKIEYTIYFLNSGDLDATEVRICDRITANQSFQLAAYGAGKDIQAQVGTNPPLDLTAAADSSDRTQVYAANAGVPDACKLKAANTNGTVDIPITGAAGTGLPNFTLIQGSTSAGTPSNSYGFVRFMTIVP